MRLYVGSGQLGLLPMLGVSDVALASWLRAFARAKGLQAKTDPIDAAVLRAFGEALAPRPTTAPTAQQQQMGELLTRRRQLTESATCEATRK